MSSIECTLPAAWGSYAHILHETLGSPTHPQSAPRSSCPANYRFDIDKRSWLPNPLWPLNAFLGTVPASLAIHPHLAFPAWSYGRSTRSTQPRPISFLESARRSQAGDGIGKAWKRRTLRSISKPRSKRRTKTYSITDSLSRTSVHAQLRARRSN